MNVENSPGKKENPNLEGISCVVLDMDGTLYRFTGGAVRFSDSKFKDVMLSNAYQFIRDREKTEEGAQEIFTRGIEDEVGLSRVCATRYGITRGEYFSVVWKINPFGLIESEPGLQTALEAIVSRGIDLRLVTSAPKIWQENVCMYLGIRDIFTEVITAEAFLTKREVFSSLATMYEPRAVLSLGDQFETDIAPALALGMNGICVSGPKQLIEIVQGGNV